MARASAAKGSGEEDLDDFVLEQTEVRFVAGAGAASLAELSISGAGAGAEAGAVAVAAGGRCGGRRGVGRSRAGVKESSNTSSQTEERMSLTGCLRPRTGSGIERTGGSGKETWLEKDTGRRSYFEFGIERESG